MSNVCNGWKADIHMLGCGVVRVLTALLWLLCLPVVVLVIGFAGSKLWSSQAIIEELSNGQIMGVAVRLAVIIVSNLCRGLDAAHAVETLTSAMGRKQTLARDNLLSCNPLPVLASRLPPIRSTGLSTCLSSPVLSARAAMAKGPAAGA